LIDVQNYYCCAKMMAEKTATEEAARRGLELAVVVPSMTIGPALQQAMNMSIAHIARYMMGTKKVSPNAVAAYTDVRDVARAHLLVYERRHDASSSRYLCIGAVLHRSRLVQLLGDLFPNYHVTAKYVIMFNAHIWILFICPFERCLTNVSCMVWQVRRRRQANGQAVQVLQQEAQGPGTGVHSY
jgi:hypothetical protein